MTLMYDFIIHYSHQHWTREAWPHRIQEDGQGMEEQPLFISESEQLQKISKAYYAFNAACEFGSNP